MFDISETDLIVQIWKIRNNNRLTSENVDGIKKVFLLTKELVENGQIELLQVECDEDNKMSGVLDKEETSDITAKNMVKSVSKDDNAVSDTAVEDENMVDSN